MIFLDSQLYAPSRNTCEHCNCVSNYNSQGLHLHWPDGQKFRPDERNTRYLPCVLITGIIEKSTGWYVSNPSGTRLSITFHFGVSSQNIHIIPKLLYVFFPTFCSAISSRNTGITYQKHIRNTADPLTKFDLECITVIDLVTRSPDKHPYASRKRIGGRDDWHIRPLVS